MTLLPLALYSLSGPPNLQEAKAAIVRYHDSGRWAKDREDVTKKAARWIDERSKRGGKLALVLDIDETALDNWSEETATDFGYVPELWAAWEKAGTAPAVPAVLALYRDARAHGVAVFFVTGRREPSREGTARNLANVGYADYAGLDLKPSEYHEKSVVPYKSGRRAAIEAQGYTIVANVGDQRSDLEGGHAERSFLLPNPMYRVN